MKRLILFIVTLCIGISFSSCTKNTVSKVSTGKPLLENSTIVTSKIGNTEEFIKSLEKSGYKTKTIKQDNNRFLSGTLTLIAINETNIGIYEYKNNQEMEQDSKTISSDASMIGYTIYDWKATPHFYKKGNIIVSYFGDNKEIIETLEKLLGQQFAGMA